MRWLRCASGCDQLWRHWTNDMATIHDEIDGLLAADLHGQLSETEREALHTHLIECASCRRAHQETKAMNKVLEDTFEAERPDPMFEERIAVGFRARVRHRKGNLAGAFIHFAQLRQVRWAAVAAVLLVLISIGRWLTNPGYILGNEELAVSAGPRPGSFADLRQRLVADEIPSDPRYREIVKNARVGIPPAFVEDVSGPQESGAASAAKAKKDETGPNPVLALNRDLVEKPGNRQVETVTSGVASSEEREIVTGSNIPTAEEVAAQPAESLNPAVASRKLIRNATVDLEVVSFDQTLQ